MLIDCHAHSYTKEDIKGLLSSMEENGIDEAVIMYWPWQNLGGHEVPPIEEVLQNIAPHRNLHLAGSIAIGDNKNFDNQFEKLEKSLSKKEIVGVKLCLGYEHLFANAPEFDKIYELCAKYDVPVIYHTGDTWSKVENALVRYANPIYVDDVAIRFPDVKILISHIGNPCWIKETAEVIYKNENAFADFSGTLPSPGSQFEKFGTDSLKEEILWLISYCETPQKLLFGTDYYVHPQAPYVNLLNSLESIPEFSTDDVEHTRHKTAEKLFGI